MSLSYYSNVLFFFFWKFFSLDFYLSWKVRPNSAKWIYGPSPLLISGTHMSGLSIEVSGRIYSGDPTSRNECKNGRQTFGKMSFLDSAMRTRYNLWIIREKTEPLVWMYYQLFTVVTLKIREKLSVTCSWSRCHTLTNCSRKNVGIFWKPTLY